MARYLDRYDLVEVIRFGDEVGQKEFRAFAEKKVFESLRLCPLRVELVEVNNVPDIYIKLPFGRVIACDTDDGAVARSFQVAAEYAFPPESFKCRAVWIYESEHKIRRPQRVHLHS